MPVSAFDLCAQGILNSAKPASGGGFSYVGVDNNGTTYFEFPALLPDTQEFMIFSSYIVNNDQRGYLYSIEEANTGRGLRVDDNSSDGFAEPEVDWPMANASDTFYNAPLTDAAHGDVLNLIQVGSISGGSATNRAILWEETGGVVTTLRDSTDGGGTATAFDFSRFSPSIPTLFAAANGNRIADLICYRFAFWDDADFTAAVPNPLTGTVRDNFFNSSTGALVDPATSHSAYGTPIYDFYGSLADWNAGTNKGHGGDLTRVGAALTEA